MKCDGPRWPRPEVRCVPWDRALVSFIRLNSLIDLSSLQFIPRFSPRETVVSLYLASVSPGLLILRFSPCHTRVHLSQSSLGESSFIFFATFSCLCGRDVTNGISDIVRVYYVVRLGQPSCAVKHSRIQSGTAGIFIRFSYRATESSFPYPSVSVGNPIFFFLFPSFSLLFFFLFFFQHNARSLAREIFPRPHSAPATK